jgi:hypothetical protein
LRNTVFVSQQRLSVQLRKARVTMRLEAYRGARLEQICHNMLSSSIIYSHEVTQELLDDIMVKFDIGEFYKRLSGLFNSFLD